MPKVLNRLYTRELTENMVYIGRPSKWGNPFPLRIGYTREQVIEKYQEWLMRNPILLSDLHELRDMDLVCWCAPRPCHGDILLLLANTD